MVFAVNTPLHSLYKLDNKCVEKGATTKFSATEQISHNQKSFSCVDKHKHLWCWSSYIKRYNLPILAKFCNSI